MTSIVNTREIILGALMEITEEEAYSHVVLREVLEKYQYLDKRDRAFITRLVEGTLEHMIQLDYIIEQFSKVRIQQMKPLIRNLLRISVYQLKYMDSIPDSAVCNEAVKLAQRRGFYSLKGFVNGVLRNVARGISDVAYPDSRTEPIRYLAVQYSVPDWMVAKWVGQFGYETTEKICADFQTEKGTSVRCNLDKASKEEIMDSLRGQGIHVEEHPYLPYALEISGYNYLKAVEAFRNGWIQVQDISSMLVAEAAAPNWGDYCIDVCAAPGGKALHIADKLRDSGFVEARDVSEYKVNWMQENIDRIGAINMKAVVQDATIYDADSLEKADILIADLPCSGFGVIGKKQDIKYKMTQAKQDEIVKLQRKILHVVQNYVKPGGTMIYSTCTIGADENQYNVKWFLERYPFQLESLNPYICDELKSKTTKAGYIQLLPGVHKSDGFFNARFRKKER